MMDELQRAAIRRVAEPILEASRAELVELTLHRHGGQWLVRCLVDKVGGVTLQDCARLNQQIGQALDDANVFTERYTLEVSSPGLDRPLVTKRDFERALGEALELEVAEAVRGSTRLKGTLLAVQPEAVVLVTAWGPVTVALTDIRSAVKAIHMTRE